MNNLLDLTRESHKQQKVLIERKIDQVLNWVTATSPAYVNDVKEFIEKYFHHLNRNTIDSMFDNILDKSDTKLIEMGKKDDLKKLLEELLDLKDKIKSL